jgi:hypothetical protein
MNVWFSTMLLERSLSYRGYHKYVATLKAAEAVGECLHLNHMSSASDAMIKERKVNSRADYGWVKLGARCSFFA